MELALERVILNQRRGVLLVDPQPVAHDFLGFVGAHDELAAAAVADALDLRRHELDVVDRLARRVRARAARQDAIEHHLVGHLDVDHAGQLHAELDENPAQSFRLRDGAREAVENEALARIGFGEPVFHHVEDQAVRDEPARVHERLGLPAQFGARGDVAAQDVAGADVRRLGQSQQLLGHRAFARAGRA